MFQSKLKLLLFAAAFLLTFIVASVAWNVKKANKADTIEVVEEEEKPETLQGCLYTGRDDRFYRVPLNKNNEERLFFSNEQAIHQSARPSPKGDLFAYWVSVPDQKEFLFLEIADKSMQPVGKTVKFSKDSVEPLLCWSPDGATIHVSKYSLTRRNVIEHYSVDLKTHEVQKHDYLENHMVFDWSEDGQYFLTQKIANSQGLPSSIYLANVNGHELRKIIQGKQYSYPYCLSRDGSKVLALCDGFFLEISIKGPSVRFHINVQEQSHITSAAWSPDGKYIAYTTGSHREYNRTSSFGIMSRLDVYDPLKKTSRTLRKVTGENMTSVFWR